MLKIGVLLSKHYLVNPLPAIYGVEVDSKEFTYKLYDTYLPQLQTIFDSAKVTYSQIEYNVFEGFDLDKDILKDYDAVVLLPANDNELASKEIGSFISLAVLTDYEVVIKRLERLSKLGRKISNSQMFERKLLSKAVSTLEENKPLNVIHFSENERKLLKGFSFISLKPFIVVTKSDTTFQGCYTLTAEIDIEAELVSMDSSERQEFLEEFGIDITLHKRLAEKIVEVTAKIKVYTANSSEAKVWLFEREKTVVDFASYIHSDLAKNFVRAEVLNVKDIVDAGSIKVAKEKNILKTVGKGYIIKNEDFVQIKARV